MWANRSAKLIVSYQFLLIIFLLTPHGYSVQRRPNINSPPPFSPQQQEDLMFYAKATWKSMVSLTFPNGLPSDRMDDDDDDPVTHTSVTNIACYMWSVIVARDLNLISNKEAVERLKLTLESLMKLEQYNGHFLNWYNVKTYKGSSEKFVSSVDSSWLAVALVLVKNAVHEVRDQAATFLGAMDLSIFYDKPTGCISTGFYPLKNKTTGNDYCTLNTETRITAYMGIGRKQIPKQLYFKLKRTNLPDCSGSWAEMKPGGYFQNYCGKYKVFEGHYKYSRYKVVPSWGGSMFEALMVPLVIPEESWGRKSWAINHALYVKAQIYHGLKEAKYGYWGFSPAYNPSGGYKEYGVDAIGINPNGYYSNNNDTDVDYGYPGCGRDPKPIPPPSDYVNGVVTPHAIFLGLAYEPQNTIDMLHKLKNSFDVFGKYGFYDAVNVQTGEVARKHLSLDQGMIMAALGNALKDNCLQRYFAAEPGMKERLKPLISELQFSAGIDNCP